jgi:hypothetical protein
MAIFDACTVQQVYVDQKQMRTQPHVGAEEFGESLVYFRIIAEPLSEGVPAHVINLASIESSHPMVPPPQDRIYQAGQLDPKQVFADVEAL